MMGVRDPEWKNARGERRLLLRAWSSDPSAPFGHVAAWRGCRAAANRLDPPANLEGISFVPLLSDPDPTWKRAVFMTGNSPAEQAVQTRTHSYLIFRDPATPAVLFDLEKDRWETVKVVNEPAYARARDEMARLLRDGWKAALPPQRGESR